MAKCPHINKCDQSIDSNRFPLCLGEVKDWNFDDCFKYRDNEKESKPSADNRFPKEWDKVTQ